MDDLYKLGFSVNIMIWTAMTFWSQWAGWIWTNLSMTELAQPTELPKFSGHYGVYGLIAQRSWVFRLLPKMPGKKWSIEDPGVYIYGTLWYIMVHYGTICCIWYFLCYAWHLFFQTLGCWEIFVNGLPTLGSRVKPKMASWASWDSCGFLR